VVGLHQVAAQVRFQRAVVVGKIRKSVSAHGAKVGMLPHRMKPLAASLLFAAAAAQAANPYLEEGRRLYGKLQFKEALTQLSIAKDVPSLDAKEKAEVLDLLARCEVAEGRREEAQRHYEELLGIDWRAELPRDLSPKILETFDEAKRHVFEPDFVAFRGLGAAPGVARAEVVDPWHEVAEVRWVHRAANTPRWVQAAVPIQDHLFVIDLAGQGEPWLAWYAEARRADGVVLAHWRSETEPQVYSESLGIATPQAAPEPARGHRLASAILGGVALVAIATGGLLAQQSRSDAAAAQGQPWADQAIAQHSRALTEARVSIAAFAGAGGVALAGAVLFVW
jgi:hypothetical protein